MSDTSDTSSNPADGQEDVDSLRAKAQAGEAAQREAEQARRELAMMRAGVDTETRFGQLVMSSYEGELDPQSISDYAAEQRKELGIPEPSTTVPETTVSPEEAAARSNIEGQVAGNEAAPPAATTDERDPREVGIEQFWERRKEGVPPEQASREYFDRVVDAGVSGDQRVLYNAQEFHENARILSQGWGR